MPSYKLDRFVRRVTLSVASLSLVFAQVGALLKSDAQREYIPPSSLNASLRLYAYALGSRVAGPGKERVAMTGTLLRGAVTSTVAMTWEHPGRFRFEESGGRGRSITIDRSSVNGRAAIDDDDEDVLESFGLDTAEEFLYSAFDTRAARLLGQRFRIRDETGFGSEVDVFEFPSEIRGRRDQAQRVKLVMFDSATGLLRRIAYTVRKGNQSLRIETVYGNYSLVDGNLLPGEIRRLEASRETLRFTRSAASIVARQADSAFRIP